MNKRDSLLEAYLKRGFSRRSFLKGCVALTSLMGLSTDMLSKVVEAAETKPLPVVIWIHGHECTGCDESFIRSAAPLASDVVLTSIALEYDHLLSAACGAPFEAHLDETIQKYNGQYILAVEGAIATKDNGVYCMSGGHTFTHLLSKAAKGAAAIIAYGSCAAYGGIQAAKPNPTGSEGVREFQPSVFLGAPDNQILREARDVNGEERREVVIVRYVIPLGHRVQAVARGTVPPLDGDGRPKQFFGNRIHDTCYRRPFFDAGMFAETYDDAGSRAGYCLYKLGCRGPETYNSCGNLRWWQGMSYPIQSGAACIGCSNRNFWDETPFSGRLPKYDKLGDADKIGVGLGVLTAAGVGAHAVASIIQRNQRDDLTEEEHKDR